MVGPINRFGLCAKAKLDKSFFWLMLRDIFKFNRLAKQDHEAGALGTESLGHWLKRKRMSRIFINRYLLPMGAAIWSTPADEILNFPAASFTILL